MGDELIAFASKQEMLAKSRQFWNPDKTQFWIDAGSHVPFNDLAAMETARGGVRELQTEPAGVPRARAMLQRAEKRVPEAVTDARSVKNGLASPNGSPVTETVNLSTDEELAAFMAFRRRTGD